MSKLLVYFDGELVETRQLDRERIVIGRKPNNDLQLPHNAVSGSHALITTIRNDSFLEDLSSTNGTKVNGKSIKKCLLRDGDEIRIAYHTLKYVFEPVELAPSDEMSRRSEKARHLENLIQSANDTLSIHEDMGRTQIFSSTMEMNSTAGNTGGRPAGKAAPSGPLQHAGLQILSGVGAGKEMDLERMLTTLGKPGIQVAVITRRPEGYTLTHLEGEQMPLLNGKAIGPQPYILEDHDIIEIAGIKLEFFLKGHASLPNGSKPDLSASPR